MMADVCALFGLKAACPLGGGAFMLMPGVIFWHCSVFACSVPAHVENVGCFHSSRFDLMANVGCSTAAVQLGCIAFLLCIQG
jgi:hypothetical protein